MVRAKVIVLDEDIGDFDFGQLPRTTEDFAIPWPADPFGLRWFVVEEVHHYAAGTPSEHGPGPLTLLISRETL